jgi:protein SOK2
MNGSPSQQNGSARGTARNSNGTQQWTTGYHTPPRAPPSSNLYNPMSDARGSVPNGSTNTDHYSTPIHPYAPTQSNGVNASSKRMREDDDYNSRPASRSDDIEAMKRRKMSREGTGASSMVTAYEPEVKPLNRARNIATPRARVR